MGECRRSTLGRWAVVYCVSLRTTNDTRPVPEERLNQPSSVTREAISLLPHAINVRSAGPRIVVSFTHELPFDWRTLLTSCQEGGGRGWDNMGDSIKTTNNASVKTRAFASHVARSRAHSSITLACGLTAPLSPSS